MLAVTLCVDFMVHGLHDCSPLVRLLNYIVSIQHYSIIVTCDRRSCCSAKLHNYITFLNNEQSKRSQWFLCCWIAALQCKPFSEHLCGNPAAF